MADIINQQLDGHFKDKHFTADQMYELRIAAWMHDIGKVTTPVEIVEKAKKLQTIFDRIHYINVRMDYLLQKVKLKGMEKKIELMQKGVSPEIIQKIDEEMTAKIAELKDIKEFINRCNEPGEFLEDDNIQRLQDISKMTYVDEDGNEQNFLDENELLNLSIRRGSITEAERKKMQDHASVTLKMLNQIPFTKKLKNIPLFAGAHHEYINGKGYPLGLAGDEIPFEGKLMAVTDIAEALTASDRPYKKAMPLNVVYKILRSMAKNGELDNEMVELFINEGVYEKYKQKYETLASPDTETKQDEQLTTTSK